MKDCRKKKNDGEEDESKFCGDGNGDNGHGSFILGWLGQNQASERRWK